jgi:hypothetical protein
LPLPHGWHRPPLPHQSPVRIYMSNSTLCWRSNMCASSRHTIPSIFIVAIGAPNIKGSWPERDGPMLYRAVGRRFGRESIRMVSRRVRELRSGPPRRYCSPYDCITDCSPLAVVVWRAVEHRSRSAHRIHFASRVGFADDKLAGFGQWGIVPFPHPVPLSRECSAVMLT